MIASSTPAAIAGRAMGRLTSKNARTGPRPSVRAASQAEADCWAKAVRARR